MYTLSDLDVTIVYIVTYIMSVFFCFQAKFTEQATENNRRTQSEELAFLYTNGELLIIININTTKYDFYF